MSDSLQVSKESEYEAVIRTKRIYSPEALAEALGEDDGHVVEIRVGPASDYHQGCQGNVVAVIFESGPARV